MNTKKSHNALFFFVIAMVGLIFLVGCTRSSVTDTKEGQTPAAEQDQSIDDGLNSGTKAIDLLTEIEQEVDQKEEVETDENIEGKKKLLIRKGDYYSFKQDLKAAIRAYELAWLLSQKQDTSIAAKMANLYFEQKMFANAVEFFEKGDIINLPTKDKIQYVRALQYVQDPSFLNKIESLNLTDYLHEYFLTSETCIREAVRCDEKIRAYSYEYEPGKRLKQALETYEKLGISDSTYKEALLVSAFYANEDYKAMAQIGNRILKTRPDYLAILKLTGYAHYELKEYDEALTLLEKYKQYNSTDTQIDYIMGLIYAEKEDYVTSNLYLNNAVLGGFEPKDSAERKLAYNYYLLDLKQNMFQVLHHLLMGENTYEEDFTNAIYLAMEEDDMRKASMWISRGLTLYPESAHLHALSGWQLRRIGHDEEAKTMLDKAIDLDKKNALAYLQLGILAYEQDDTKEAYKNFNRASILDPKGIFGSQVDQYLEKILEREEITATQE